MRALSYGSATSPYREIGVGQGGGPTLIARRYFYANATDTVPAGATRATVRALGQGGMPSDQYYGGGGGAYARGDLACSPGQSVSITVGSASVQGRGLDGVSTVVSINGISIVAAGGKTSNPPGAAAAGGLAVNCVGTIRRSGGSGSSTTGSDGFAGENGGPGGTTVTNGFNPSSGSGGSAGDLGDIDSLGLGFRGVDPDGVYGPGSGGGANGLYPSGGSQTRPYAYTPSGLAVIEYWSS